MSADTGEQLASRLCPYCREPIDSGATEVVCPVCGTAHHERCWNANHGCTRFGCSGGLVSPKQSDTNHAVGSDSEDVSGSHLNHTMSPSLEDVPTPTELGAPQFPATPSPGGPGAYAASQTRTPGMSRALSGVLIIAVLIIVSGAVAVYWTRASQISKSKAYADILRRYASKASGLDAQFSDIMSKSEFTATKLISDLRTLSSGIENIRCRVSSSEAPEDMQGFKDSFCSGLTAHRSFYLRLADMLATSQTDRSKFRCALSDLDSTYASFDNSKLSGMQRLPNVSPQDIERVASVCVAVHDLQSGQGARSGYCSLLRDWISRYDDARHRLGTTTRQHEADPSVNHLPAFENACAERVSLREELTRMSPPDGCRDIHETAYAVINLGIQYGELMRSFARCSAYGETDAADYRTRARSVGRKVEISLAHLVAQTNSYQRRHSDPMITRVRI